MEGTDMRKDNRGLTLIELIVTVAIGMIFSGVILTFIAGASKSYRYTSSGAQSQMDMQDALDQLENMAMNANLSMYYVKGKQTTKKANVADKIEKDSDIDNPLNQSKTLFIGNKDEGADELYYVIVWDADTEKLTVFTQGIGSGTGGMPSTAETIAENVTQFAADIHDAPEQHTVRFKLITKVNGREIEKAETVNLRNDVVIAAPGKE